MIRTVLSKKIKSRLIAIIILSVLPLASLIAGEIYGRVAINGKVFANAEVTIKCTNNFKDSQVTNSNGAYRSKDVMGETECTISVSNANNDVTVYTSQSRTRVNLEVKGSHLYRR